MANLAVIGVLFKRFYGYLVVLGIFALFGGVVTLKVGVSRKRDKNFATDDIHFFAFVAGPIIVLLHQKHGLQQKICRSVCVLRQRETGCCQNIE